MPKRTSTTRPERSTDINQLAHQFVKESTQQQGTFQSYPVQRSVASWPRWDAGREDRRKAPAKDYDDRRMARSRYQGSGSPMEKEGFTPKLTGRFRDATRLN